MKANSSGTTGKLFLQQESAEGEENRFGIEDMGVVKRLCRMRETQGKQGMRETGKCCERWEVEESIHPLPN